MHAVIRRYRVRLGSVRRVVRDADKEFLPLLRQIPGFAACYLLDGGNHVLTSIGLFETAAGSQAAVELHAAWFRDDWSSVVPVAPEVIRGEVLAQANAGRVELGGVVWGARAPGVVPGAAALADEGSAPGFVALPTEAPPTATSW